MKNSFLSSSSFKIRTKVSIGIFLIVVIGALTPNAIILRSNYTIAAILSICEIFTFAGGRNPFLENGWWHGILSAEMLCISIAMVQGMPRDLLILGVVLTFASDVGAYFAGKFCGTKFIPVRPFPVVSPGKSWEGVIGGLCVPMLVIPVFNLVFRTNLPLLAGPLAGFCAIVGDLNESALKRRCGVKDANDILKTKRGFRQLEALLGGSEGHGGYYDRLDSMSMVLFLFGLVATILQQHSS